MVQSLLWYKREREMEANDHDKLETVKEWNALVSSNKNFITIFSPVFFYLLHILSNRTWNLPNKQGLCVATFFCFFNGEVIAQLKRKWRIVFFRPRANSYTATQVSVRIWKENMYTKQHWVIKLSIRLCSAAIISYFNSWRRVALEDIFLSYKKLNTATAAPLHCLVGREWRAWLHKSSWNNIKHKRYIYYFHLS